MNQSKSKSRKTKPRAKANRRRRRQTRRRRYGGRNLYNALIGEKAEKDKIRRICQMLSKQRNWKWESTPIRDGDRIIDMFGGPISLLNVNADRLSKMYMSNYSRQDFNNMIITKPNFIRHTSNHRQELLAISEEMTKAGMFNANGNNNRSHVGEAMGAAFFWL